MNAPTAVPDVRGAARLLASGCLRRVDRRRRRWGSNCWTSRLWPGGTPTACRTCCPTSVFTAARLSRWGGSRTARSSARTMPGDMPRMAPAPAFRNWPTRPAFRPRRGWRASPARSATACCGSPWRMPGGRCRRWPSSRIRRPTWLMPGRTHGSRMRLASSRTSPTSATSPGCTRDCSATPRVRWCPSTRWRPTGTFCDTGSSARRRRPATTFQCSATRCRWSPSAARATSCICPTPSCSASAGAANGRWCTSSLPSRSAPIAARATW